MLMSYACRRTFSDAVTLLRLLRLSRVVAAARADDAARYDER